MRRWTINGRFLTQPVSGVQRYAHEILAALDLLLETDHPLAKDLDIELICPASAQLPELRSITARHLAPAQGHLWEQMVLPFAGHGGLISLCNTGPLSHSKHIVCIHDLNTRLIPHNYSKSFLTLYRVLLPALGKRASRITTVSHFSARMLSKYGIAPLDKISVVGNGHEHALRWPTIHSTTTRTAAGPRTIVVFGAGSPNKNVRMLIAMADQLAEAGFRLAIAGATDLRVFSSGTEVATSQNVVCLGRLSDGEIAALLSDSFCLAFPSLIEGFGLPPLEAMSLGCPVVVSDTSCLPEICGDAALYAPPTDPQAWLDRFLRLRQDPLLRAGLIEKGRQRATRFSWARSAIQYLELMARADGIVVATQSPLANASA